MKTNISTSHEAVPRPRTLLIPCRREGLQPALERIANLIGVEPALLSTEFRAFRETWRILHPVTGPAKLCLLGLGLDVAPDSLRQALRRFVFHERPFVNGELAVDLLAWTNLDLNLGNCRHWIEAAVQGCVLGASEIGGFKTGQAVESAAEGFRRGSTLDLLQLLVPERLADRARQAVDRGAAVAAAQAGAIDLVNAPSNHLTPTDLARIAAERGKTHGFSVHVFDKEMIEKEGMGGLLAVNRGSSLPPTFTILDYLPEGASKEERPAVGLVGKGVTFDTGGISLKESTDLSNMKCDMAGAAAVLGALEAAARLGLRRRVVGAIPSTDNKPDGSAQNPGDVIRTYNGTTVEVEDTDAEGRLILADALAYLNRRFNPTALIDLATLTGAVYVALGDHAAGLFCNNDGLAARLLEAGTRSHERLWRLPLWSDYDRQIESDVADLKNYGGRPAGAVTAARFLQRFIGEHPAWAHLDIAGVAFSQSEFARRRHATGFGVRVLTEFIAGLDQTVETPLTD